MKRLLLTILAVLALASILAIGFLSNDPGIPGLEQTQNFIR